MPRAALHICLSLTIAVFVGCSSARTDTAADGTRDRTNAEAQRAGNRSAGPDVIEMSSLRERALEILNEAAFSDSALMRANAIEGLHPVPTRAEEIVRMALTDENVGVRYAAATSVGILELEDSAEQVRALLDDSDGSVRAAAIFALHRLGEDVNISPLADLLQSRSARTRAQVVWLIGEMGDPSAIPMLADIAKQKTRGTPVEDRLFRMQVAEALVKLGEFGEVSTLRAALYPSSRSEFEVAVLAAQIIGEVEDRGASAQLVNLIEAEASNSKPSETSWLYPAELRLQAAAALAKMGFDDGTYVAREYMGHDNDAVRAQSAYVLAEIGQKENLQGLEALLEDESPLVQVYAAAGILKILES